MEIQSHRIVSMEKFRKGKPQLQQDLDKIILESEHFIAGGPLQADGL